MRIASLLTVATVLTCAARAPAAEGPAAEAAPKPQPLVQVGLLLDTSNSMDGLIDQAKAQLWSIVNEFATARRQGERPRLQVALYEYGNDGLPAEAGHIRLVLPLTDDLDRVSQELFALKTNGGQEYCGWVVREAATNLLWSASTADYKAIFIAGNEPFSQGSVDYKASCKTAITKGILVNTIFCGPLAEGENSGWKDGALLADGRYMNIDQNKREVHIAAPQDKEIERLGLALNETYVAYGSEGADSASRQARQEVNATTMGGAAMVQRQVVKAGAMYLNPGWDLVDASKQAEFKLEDVKEDALPEELKKLTVDERKDYVAKKARERETLQGQIKTLSEARDKFVAAERRKRAEAGEATLGAAVIGAVREQAVERGFSFEK